MARSLTRSAIPLVILILTAYTPTANAYLIAGSKWGQPTLGTGGGTVTWGFETRYAGCSDLSCTEVADIMEVGFQHEFQRAFDAWEAVANISFVSLEPGQSADISIGTHYFNGGAHAFFPQDGDIHFSTIFRWGIEDFFPIFPIALHEIGHAIGLDHTQVAEASMYPSTSPGYALRYKLHADDIAGVQRIYGAAVPVPGVLWLLAAGLLGMRLVRLNVPIESQPGCNQT